MRSAHAGLWKERPRRGPGSIDEIDEINKIGEID